MKCSTMKTFLAWMCFSLAGFSLSPVGAEKAEIHPDLLTLPVVSEKDEVVHVTLKLSRQADIPGLLQILEASSAARGERHSTVIRTLRDVAAESQPPVLTELEALRSEGDVLSFSGYWISNIIEVTCRSRAVSDLAQINGVAAVYPTPEAVPVEVIETGREPSGAAGAEPGPRVIAADSLWRLGITGQGRVVGHIDSGVDGNHPALSGRWRGNFAPPEECWLAPGTVFPFDSTGHGTATMGVLAGRDSGTGDTTGVAIDALWIAARWGLGPNSVSTTEALQWMADPDGNPGTFDDVPDVVNNSWVYAPETQCFQTDWDVIDNLEAAGACVMFSAANSGPDPGTVASPGSRNTSSTNGFAVGAVNNSKRIADFSARGPSPCDDITKKPEVTTPGVNTRTTSVGGGYTRASGTSISCPFASGVVALLRQLNPEASVEEVKQAILLTAEDRGGFGDDNTYGMGVVNAYEAAQMISPYRITGEVTDAVSGESLSDARIMVRETGQINFTDIAGMYDIGALTEEVSLVIDKFGYYPDTSGVFSLGGSPEVYDVELVPLATGRIEGTMTDSTTGSGILAGVILQANGEAVDTAFTDPETGGFSFEDVPVSLPPLVTYSGVEGRFIMPYPSSVMYPDTFTVEEGASTHLGLSAAPARVLIVDDDDGANYEKFFTSSVDSAGWSYYHHDVNETGESVIYSLDVFPAQTILLWYTGTREETLTEEEQDSLGAFLDRGGKLLLTGQNIAEDLSSTGSPFLSQRLGAAYGGNTTLEQVRGFYNDPVFGDILMETTGLGGAFDQYSRDIIISDGGSEPACYYTEEGGGSDSLIAGLRIDDSELDGSRIIFLGFGFEAVNRPSPQDSLIATRAEVMAEMLTWLEGPVGIRGGDRNPIPETVPRIYALSQNFPNPFNPSTTITFDIPADGSGHHEVKLVIYDIRGRVMKTLLDVPLPAGRHQVVWDGRGESGRQLPSGIYLYRLTVDGRVFTRKMLLLK